MAEAAEIKARIGLPKNYRDVLNGLTHPGIEQLRWRVDEEFAFGSNYPPDTIVHLLERATEGLAHATLVITGTAGRADLAERVGYVLRDAMTD